MSTTFGFDVRMMVCPNCAAPSEVPPEGGTSFCGYCGQQSQWAPRNQAPLAPQGRAPIDENQRLQRLRAQDGKPLLPPQALHGLIEGGGLASWKIEEAVQIWQSLRQQVIASQDYNAAEQLLFLTMLLSNHYSDLKDFARQRAMFESALEAFSLPRHIQMMRGFLARSAAADGDLDAAEQWLAPCDPASDDLQSDSAYRLSWAVIGTARGNFDVVLHVLGANQQDVPIMDAMDAGATVFRANAWERKGNIQAAAGLLQQYMGAGGASGRAAIKGVIDRYAGWNLCQQSFTGAEAQYSQHASAKAAAQASGGIGPIFFYLGILMLAGSGIGLVVGLISGRFIAGVLGPLIAGGVFTVIGFNAKKSAAKAARLRTHGIQTHGKVVGVQRTGVKINNSPQFRITLEISIEGAGTYQASTTMLMARGQAGQFKQGLSLPVRVDPDDPQSFILELD